MDCCVHFFTFLNAASLTLPQSATEVTKWHKVQSTNTSTNTIGLYLNSFNSVYGYWDVRLPFNMITWLRFRA